VGEADTGRSLSPSELGEQAHPQGDPGLPSPTLRRVTLVLCLTQIVSWGVLFYAFPVLAPTIAETEGWSLTSLMAAPPWLCNSSALAAMTLAGLAVYAAVIDLVPLLVESGQHAARRHGARRRRGLPGPGHPLKAELFRGDGASGHGAASSFTRASMLFPSGSLTKAQ
jgi:hypothetical protein